jgi:hypothetical protein
VRKKAMWRRVQALKELGDDSLSKRLTELLRVYPNLPSALKLLKGLVKKAQQVTS